MIDTATYLGPATVTATEGRPGFVEVALPEGERLWARLALAVPYRPAEGDEILLAGLEPGYVIGLLRGSGSLTLEAPGGVRIRSGTSIEVSAPQVTIRAGRLDTIAHRVVEKAREFHGWISGLFHLDAERIKAAAQSDLDLKGARASLKADEAVTVDGKDIYLG